MQLLSHKNSAGHFIKSFNILFAYLGHPRLIFIKGKDCCVGCNKMQEVRMLVKKERSMFEHCTLIRSDSFLMDSCLFVVIYQQVAL